MNQENMQYTRRSSLRAEPSSSHHLSTGLVRMLSGSPQQHPKAKPHIIHLTKRIDVHNTVDDQDGLPSVYSKQGEDVRAIAPAPLKSLAASLRRNCNSAPSIRKPQPVSKHLFETYLALKVAGSLPKPDLHQLERRHLPPPTKAKTVVFDLDETLVHKCDSLRDADVVLPIQFPSGEVTEVGVRVRPFALQCLVELSENWEIVVFTASQRCYADAVLDYLDGGRGIIAHRLYREHCQHIGSVTVKDLRVLPHRPLTSVVLIDNAATNFAYQLDNGIPIRPWTGSSKDRELLKLAAFLKRLYFSPDCMLWTLRSALSRAEGEECRLGC